MYAVTVLVTDPLGATATASASIQVAPGAPAAELAAIDVAGGAPFTARPEVSVDVRGPPGAVQAELANAADFAGAVPVPLAPGVPWRLGEAAPDGPRRVFVRFIGAGGHHLPGFDRVDDVDLDRAPPVLGRARATPSAPVLVCAPGGRGVAGTSRRRVPVTIRVAVRDRLSGLRTLQGRSSSSSARPVRGPPWSVTARPGGIVEVRAVDAAGNASRWRPVRVRPAAVEVVDSASRPFTRATACRSIGQTRLIQRVNGGWRAGAPGGDRAWIRPAGSHLTWTVYSGQGLFPNWVHAGTDLNGRLHKGSAADYRRAVSEVVAMSTLDRAGGRAFRVNENLFAVPEDGHPPPWRDAMGTGLILALIAPALSPAADAHERDAARRVAGQYLSAFSVDHDRGGLVLDTQGPGVWYLEYTYRSRDRVLNGFLQSVVSLARFARQAHRLSLRHPEWAPSRTAPAAASCPAPARPATGCPPTTWGVGRCSTNSGGAWPARRTGPTTRSSWPTWPGSPTCPPPGALASSTTGSGGAERPAARPGEDAPPDERRGGEGEFFAPGNRPGPPAGRAALRAAATGERHLQRAAHGSVIPVALLRGTPSFSGSLELEPQTADGGLPPDLPPQLGGTTTICTVRAGTLTASPLRVAPALGGCTVSGQGTFDLPTILGGAPVGAMALTEGDPDTYRLGLDGGIGSIPTVLSDCPAGQVAKNENGMTGAWPLLGLGLLPVTQSFPVTTEGAFAGSARGRSREPTTATGGRGACGADRRGPVERRRAPPLHDGQGAVRGRVAICVRSAPPWRPARPRSARTAPRCRAR